MIQRDPRSGGNCLSWGMWLMSFSELISKMVKVVTSGLIIGWGKGGWLMSLAQQEPLIWVLGGTPRSVKRWHQRDGASEGEEVAGFWNYMLVSWRGKRRGLKRVGTLSCGSMGMMIIKTIFPQKVCGNK